MLKEGTVLGERYEIVGRIGSGGMADVYKARDGKLNRYVAVKVMKSEFNNDSSFIKKFRREAQAAAGLSNPNIVNVYDVGEDQGIYYIVMELVEGITLKEYIAKKGKLSVREATSIGIQVCMGLAAAHNQGIVHRDVKPQNIIISTDGKVKVTDFGIARATSSNTISANAMGSVHYSSPEQVRGGYSDARSDIYSVGITLYEMVTGRVPFDGETTVAIAIKHLQDEMVPPSKYTPDLPYSLEQIILKCCQKSVDRRYQSMDEVISDLKRSLMEPNGHFVQLAPLSDHAQTVMITPSEREAIKAKDPQNKKTTRKRTYGSTEEAKSDEDEAPADTGRYDRRRRYEEPDDDDDDEDDDSEVGSGLEKAVTIGAFIVGALIIIVLIIVIGRQAGLFQFGASSRPTSTASESVTSVSTTGETVSVPSLLGMTADEAKTAANDVGLGVKSLGEKPSEDYPEGQIMEQDPEAGTEVEKNSTITYYVSSGSDLLEIPKVVGMTQEEAEDALTKAGFSNIDVEEQASDTVEAGEVISVDPNEGEKASADDTVKLTVSTGSEPVTEVTVRNFLGIDADTAEQQLEDDGLVVKIVYDTASFVGTDEVMDQDPEAGTTVKTGTTVTLTVNNADKASGGGTQTADGKWVSRSTLGTADNYTGGAYRLVLRQEVDGKTVDTDIESGNSLTFPYSIVIDGAPGVSSGTVYLYEETDSGEQARAQWPVTFEKES